MIIAKQVNQEVIDSNRFELFIEETVKDIEGNDVTIPRSIGTYSLQELEREKSFHQATIEELDLKINAIKSYETN